MLGKALTTAAAGNAAGEALYVEDVFSTYVYPGEGTDGSAPGISITNGVNLADEGGLVWTKRRSSSRSHVLLDSERGSNEVLRSDVTSGRSLQNYNITFNSDGYNYDIGDNDVDVSGEDYASWTFRKAPKFFDVVTYTGDGVAGREISHNLDSEVGALVIKKTNGTASWVVYHRETDSTSPEDYITVLNDTGARVENDAYTNGTKPTTSVFTVGSNGAVNGDGDTYVAYLFAHNDGDGEFGEDADQDIIKCGSFTNDGGNAQYKEVGFEPQWILMKQATATSNWYIVDNMRGFPALGSSGRQLEPNTSDAEAGFSAVYTDANGFYFDTFGTAGATWIYIAIRRGPMKTPESGTEVFANSFGISGQSYWHESGFPVDLGIQRLRTSASFHYFADRLRGPAILSSQTTDAEAGGQTNFTFDYMDGWYENLGASTAYISHMFRRAPGFFDVVAYEGDGVAGRTVSHNLGVAPELIIVKDRSTSNTNWAVYSNAQPQPYGLLLNSNGGATASGLWNSTAATATNFTVSGDIDVNNVNDNFIAYLFATLPGISKVGSYTGNGSSQTIDCGFSAGARFVLIKSTTRSTSDWLVADTERGIVAGNDPFLKLNTTDAEITTSDVFDPASSGFAVNDIGTGFNNPNDEYIFLAIA